MIGISLAFTALWLLATRSNGVLGDHIDPREARNRGRSFSLGLVAYILATGLAFVAPILSLVIYAGTALFYVFPRLPAPPHHRGG
jgi:hypothetical protein